jgi:glyoxylase-like metal-dependent hydrolase (beta-lactamase superfamily II)
MKILIRILKITGVLLLILLATGTTLYFIYVRPFMQKMKEVSVIKYDKDLTLVMGGGGNSGILVSDSLVLVIDTKQDEAALQFSKMVTELAGKKPVIVINTHNHPDHIHGNKYYKGQTIIAGGNYTRENWIKDAGEESLPTQWLKSEMNIKMGDDTATLFNLGRKSHTASDVVVYLHKRKMLFCGDVVLNKQAPVLIGTADADGYMAAFDLLPKKFDILKIVPGHGELGGPELITIFKQYFLDMQTAALDPSKKEELVAKYKDWGQLPIFMSPGATIRYYKNKKQ